MTPERAKKLRYAGEGWSDDDIVIAADFLGRRVDRLTWGELRALLDAHGKTCETCAWTLQVRDNVKISCANPASPVAGRGVDRTFGCTEHEPHCGGRVIVRDGGTT